MSYTWVVRYLRRDRNGWKHHEEGQLFADDVWMAAILARSKIFDPAEERGEFIDVWDIEREM